MSLAAANLYRRPVTSQGPWAGNRDDVSRRLATLADELDRRLTHVAALRRDELFDGSWTLTPNKRQSVGVTWTDFGDAIQIETLGGDGGRWELERTDEDIDFIVGVIEAAIAGRIRETFARGRSRVTVTFDDGTTHTETGASAAEGFLPLPLWTRWGEHRQYAPYS